MISGYSIVNGESLRTGSSAFAALNPATGETLDPPFHEASMEDLNRAAELAGEAEVSYHLIPGKARAEFLRGIASRMEANSSELVARAKAETALSEARLRSEIARTANQLLLFARLVEEGSWVDARIDVAEPERKPQPRPDLRSMLRPIGTVVSFGASNFPFAFSVAGGDMASALAAGNPVIVKAHPAHPGTSEMVGRVVADVVQEQGLHPGTFALLFGNNEFGTALVRHPIIRAVGFTGALASGKALMDACASRPDPIPCFAEMSSVNPVFVLPSALRETAAQIAARLFASFTLGVGQFHTKPGLVFLPSNEDGDALVAELKLLVEEAGCRPMISEGIARNYSSGIHDRILRSVIRTVAQADVPAGARNLAGIPALFEIDARDFLANADLAGEIFGPCTLIIRYQSRDEMLALAEGLEGQLTATIHASEHDLVYHPDLIGALERRAGRLIVNGFPTGVEVTHAMVHGGPFPATSDSRFTSVGVLAINRWVRPVCYQDFPQSCLLDELKDANPLGIARTINGTLTRDPVGQNGERLHAAHAFHKI